MFKLKICIYAILGSLLCSLACANFNATIPVIDMHDYYSSKKELFLADLAQAMQTVGFVAVVNSGVDPNILDSAYSSATRFYNQPLSQKMRYHNPNLNGQRGYVQSETAKGQKAKDFKEFYHVAREYPENIKSKYNYATNIWPDDARFVADMQGLMTELDAYSAVIAQALSISLGKDKDFLGDMIKHGDCLLRSIHYPAQPPKDAVWASAHTDIDLFTILPRATAQGLQLLDQNGTWIDVVVPDNAFIINAGDMLQNISNGLYKSAKHRVVAKDDHNERYSMVMFIHPRPNDRLDPLPHLIAKVGKRNFANVTGQELLFERLIDLGLHTPALLETFAKSGAMEKLIEVDRGSITAMQALNDANLASPTVLQAITKHTVN